MLISLTSDGFPTIKHGSNDFVVFQNNCSLNILQDLPAWEIDFKSAVKRFVRKEGWKHVISVATVVVVVISVAGVVV